MNSAGVVYGDREIGILSTKSGKVRFEYSPGWLKDGFSISPISLPLEQQSFVPEENHFGGLFGVFSDSLPDWWGTHVSSLEFARNGKSYNDLGPLEKLTSIGTNWLGALHYTPSDPEPYVQTRKDLDTLCEECMKLTDEDRSADIGTIFPMACSTGGARPKIFYHHDGDEWVIKFKERNDPPWIGKAEYEYNLAAKECGIEVPEVRLFHSDICDGYFASKRFDREGGKRVHMISLGGLLEVPRQLPLLDYVSFLQATGFITKSQDEVVKAFRLACFNIISKNMDSHSKNFAYLYSEKKGRYVLSPAYDLTRTVGMREHEMTCMGNGNPGRDDLLALADEVHIPKNTAKDILDTVGNIVSDRLSEWVAMK